jgi:hypothetical protein
MNAYTPADSPQLRGQTAAAGSTGHRALAVLDAAATLALVAVRKMLAHSDHRPVRNRATDPSRF